MTEDTFKNKPDTKNSIERKEISVDLARREDWRDYKKIRLEAIQKDPYAFGRTPDQVSEEMLNEDSEWRRDLSDRNQLIVLSKYKSEPIGISKGGRKSGNIWSLRSVYVNPDFRKSATDFSLSVDMVKKVLDEIKNKRGEIVRLWVRIDRPNAIHLYEECGFKKLNDIQALEVSGGDSEILKGWQVMEYIFRNQSDK